MASYILGVKNQSLNVYHLKNGIDNLQNFIDIIDDRITEVDTRVNEVADTILQRLLDINDVQLGLDPLLSRVDALVNRQNMPLKILNYSNDTPVNHTSSVNFTPIYNYEFTRHRSNKSELLVFCEFNVVTDGMVDLLEFRIVESNSTSVSKIFEIKFSGNVQNKRTIALSYQTTNCYSYEGNSLNLVLSIRNQNSTGSVTIKGVKWRVFEIHKQ